MHFLCLLLQKKDMHLNLFDIKGFYFKTALCINNVKKMILLWIVIYKSTLKYLRNRMCFNIFLHGKQRIIYLSRIYETCKLVSIYIQQKNKCSTILEQNTFIFIFNFSASFRCLLTYFSRIHAYALIFLSIFKLHNLRF